MRSTLRVAALATLVALGFILSLGRARDFAGGAKPIFESIATQWIYSPSSTVDGLYRCESGR